MPEIAYDSTTKHPPDQEVHQFLVDHHKRATERIEAAQVELSLYQQVARACIAGIETFNAPVQDSYDSPRSVPQPY